MSCDHRKEMTRLEESIQHKAYKLELYEKGLNDGFQYPINDEALSKDIIQLKLAQNQQLVMWTIEKNKELEKERDELLEKLEDAEFALIVEKRKGNKTVEVDLDTLGEVE